MEPIRFKTEIKYPSDINLINDVFKTNGFDLFLVGGCVRDAYIGIEPKDWDLATNAKPDEVIGILAGQKFTHNILETGKAFGVINHLTRDNEFEIATFRSDGEYSDSRRPDSVTFSNIEGDVLRRDLTCNALFYDLSTNEIVDLVGGIADIDANIINTVGNPVDRFNEDRLRILRCVRFTCRFGAELSQEVKNALSDDSSIDGISPERIRDEFLKGFKSAKNKTDFLDMLDYYGLFDFIFRDLRVDTLIDTSDDVLATVATMLRGNSNLKTVLNKLTWSTDEIQKIALLQAIPSIEGGIVNLKKRQKAIELSKETILEFMRLNGQTWGEVFTEFELKVSAEFLMRELGLSGKELGEEIHNREMVRFWDSRLDFFRFR